MNSFAYIFFTVCFILFVCFNFHNFSIWSYLHFAEQFEMFSLDLFRICTFLLSWKVKKKNANTHTHTRILKRLNWLAWCFSQRRGKIACKIDMNKNNENQLEQPTKYSMFQMPSRRIQDSALLPLHPKWLCSLSDNDDDDNDGGDDIMFACCRSLCIYTESVVLLWQL